MSDETVVAEVSQSLGTAVPETAQDEAAQKAGETAAPEVRNDETADAAADAPKHRGGFQKRIDELTRQREEERREKERLLALVERLTDKKPERAEQAKDAEPNPDDFFNREDYLDARASYVADKRADARVEAKFKEFEEREHRRAAERAASEAERAWNQRLESARTAIADFDDVVAAAGDVTPTPLVRDAILSSEDGPQMLYALSKNKSEAQRIMSLPPVLQALELGKFIAKHGATSTQTTKVPDPARSARTGSGTVDPLSDKLDINTWRKNFEKRFYGDRR